MGVVLRVKDIDLDRTLAMKRMRSAPDATGGGSESDRFARFMEEAQVTAQLDHPTIVPVHELGFDDDGTGWYTMKLVEGRELGQVFELARARAEDWNMARAIRVLAQVCQALAYAHGKGVIHRDLKPANIMVGEFGEVYVMDWGLAKVEGSDVSTPRAISGSDGQIDGGSMITLDGSVLGTPEFMPPEQARGEMDAVDEQSDVYAVGAMLYQLLAGRPPYLGESREVVKTVAAGPPDPLPNTAPTELAAIASKAMAREKTERYVGAAELEHDLTRYLDGRVVEAHESGALAEFKKLVLRNKAVTAAVAAAFAVLVAMLVSQTLANRKVERSRAEAIAALEMMAVSQGLSAGKSQDYGTAAYWFDDAAERATDPERAATHRVRAQIAASRLAPPMRALMVPPGGGAHRRMDFSPNGKHLTVWRGVGSTEQVTELYQVVDIDRENLLTTPDGSAVFSAVAHCPATGRIAVSPENRPAEVRVWTPGEKATVIENHGKVTALAFSPDGRRLFVAADHSRLYDFAKGEFSPTRYKGLEGRQTVYARYSPDGALVLTVTHKTRAEGEEYCGLRVFDTSGQSGEPLFPVHETWYWPNVCQPDFIHDGRSILCQPEPGRTVVMDARTGTITNEHTNVATDFSTARSEGVNHYGTFDLLSGAPRVTGLNIGVPRFRPDSDTFLTNRPGLREVSLRDGSTLRPIGLNRTEVEYIAVSPDGQLVAAWESDGLLRFWDLQQRDWRFPTASKGTVTFSSDGQHIASAGRPILGGLPPMETLQVYEAKSGTPAGSTMRLAQHLSDSCFSPDGTEIATGHDGGALVVWDWHKAESVLEATLAATPITVRYSPDGEWLAAMCRNGELVRIERAGGKVTSLVTHDKHRDSILTPYSLKGLEFTDSGRWLVAWSVCEGITIWDCERGERAPSPPLTKTTHIDLLELHGERVTFLELHHWEQIFDVHEWDLAKAEFAREPIDAGRGSYSNLDVSADGEQILLSCIAVDFALLAERGPDGTWSWRKVPTLGRGASFFVHGTPYAVGITPGTPSRFTMVDLRDGSALAAPLNDEISQYFHPTLSPDGRQLAAVDWESNGKNAQVWDLTVLDPHESTSDPTARRQLSGLNAGGRSDPSGWISFDAETWLAEWQNYRIKHPGSHALSSGR